MPCLKCGRLAIGGGSYCEHHKPRNGSTRAWRKLRLAILDRDGFTCQLCGAPATDIDHVRPLIDGGTDHPFNLRATCAHCNRSATI